MNDANHHIEQPSPSERASHGTGGHGHSHGFVDPDMINTQQGIRAVKWSFAVLLGTAVFQVGIVLLSGSVALYADTVHNFGDAATAIPLWIAFSLARRERSKRFTYGLGRVEDLAGVCIVLVILSSAILAGYESVQRFLEPRTVRHLWAVAAASVVGLLGNEAVARYRIKVGRKIDSAALVADGQHARVDGLTSLSVLVGSIGVWLGYPAADPIVGLAITGIILHIVWQSAKSIFTRMLDGVDPEVVDAIRNAAADVKEVHTVTDVRARWLGHRLHAEISLAVDDDISVAQGHAVAVTARHAIQHQLPQLSGITIHIDPASAPGKRHHRIDDHPEKTR